MVFGLNNPPGSHKCTYGKLLSTTLVHYKAKPKATYIFLLPYLSQSNRRKMSKTVFVVCLACIATQVSYTFFVRIQALSLRICMRLKRNTLTSVQKFIARCLVRNFQVNLYFVLAWRIYSLPSDDSWARCYGSRIRWTVVWAIIRVTARIEAILRVCQSGKPIYANVIPNNANAARQI